MRPRRRMAGSVPPGQRHGLQPMLRDSKKGPQGVHRKWRYPWGFGFALLLDEFCDPRLKTGPAHDRILQRMAASKVAS